MGKTGLNQVHVVASGANGFAAGTDVQLFLNSGTVNSVSAVGYVDREFSIENRGLLRPGGTLAAVTAAIAAGGTVGVASTVVAGTINVVNSLLAMAPDTINAGRIAGNALTATHIATAALTSAKFAASAIDAAALATDAVSEIANGLLDLADSIETGLTLRNSTRLIAAACAGKASGLATTTAVYRNAVADSKDRITATVDASGNRSSVTTDLT